MLGVGLGVVIAIGCGFTGVGSLEGPLSDGGEGPDATDQADATVDPRVDGSVAVDAQLLLDAASCSMWSPHLFDACAIPAPGAAVVLPAASTITYDTNIPGFVEDPPADPPAMTIPQGGTSAVVISVASFTIPQGTTLRVVGKLPLIIASWTTIDVQGTIDVGSSLTGKGPGAGANPATCSATSAVDGTDEADTGGGSGGGGGGAFQGSGGKGGPGDSGGQNAGGNGGGMVGPPTIVRGGCAGAASGKAGPDGSVTAPSDANTTAPGGAGGGAIQLTARQSITVGALGRVLAGGAGGGGAPLHSAVGGGGGGSGGYVGFDAPAYTFTTNARIAANGGGGGSSDGFAFTGDPGADGRDDALPAAGGLVGSCAYAGAFGAAGLTLNGPPALQTFASCGGAGGGGGAGYIFVFGAGFAVPALVLFSPAPTVVN